MTKSTVKDVWTGTVDAVDAVTDKIGSNPTLSSVKRQTTQTVSKTASYLTGLVCWEQRPEEAQIDAQANVNNEVDGFAVIVIAKQDLGEGEETQPQDNRI